MSQPFPMEFAQTVYRDRPKMVPARENPQRLVPAGWDDPTLIDTVEIPGAYVGSGSSQTLASATRTQILTTKSLFVTDRPDVQPGDRIRVGGDTYFVDALPAADVNPFTGWTGAMEIPLKNSRG